MFYDVCLCILTEDIDPSVGRFRNMVQTAVVPMKVNVFTRRKPPQLLDHGDSGLWLYRRKLNKDHFCVIICQPPLDSVEEFFP